VGGRGAFVKSGFHDASSPGSELHDAAEEEVSDRGFCVYVTSCDVRSGGSISYASSEEKDGCWKMPISSFE
jgi:hypothetical protein